MNTNTGDEMAVVLWLCTDGVGEWMCGHRDADSSDRERGEAVLSLLA